MVEHGIYLGKVFDIGIGPGIKGLLVATRKKVTDET
jgi:tRNA1(Val) A37 N6-methylase TrmN6